MVMELHDCAFPTLNKIVPTDDARVAFRDCQAALLVGRARADRHGAQGLLLANAQIFSVQGRALNEVADRNVKVLVVAIPPTPTRSSPEPTPAISIRAISRR